VAEGTNRRIIDRGAGDELMIVGEEGRDQLLGWSRRLRLFIVDGTNEGEGVRGLGLDRGHDAWQSLVAAGKKVMDAAKREEASLVGDWSSQARPIRREKIRVHLFPPQTPAGYQGKGKK
jgi:hypothetical protein